MPLQFTDGFEAYANAGDLTNGGYPGTGWAGVQDVSLVAGRPSGIEAAGIPGLPARLPEQAASIGTDGYLLLGLRPAALQTSHMSASLLIAPGSSFVITLQVGNQPFACLYFTADGTVSACLGAPRASPGSPAYPVGEWFHVLIGWSSGTGAGISCYLAEDVATSISGPVPGGIAANARPDSIYVGNTAGPASVVDDIATWGGPPPRGLGNYAVAGSDPTGPSGLPDAHVISFAGAADPGESILTPAYNHIVGFASPAYNPDGSLTPSAAFGSAQPGNNNPGITRVHVLWNGSGTGGGGGGGALPGNPPLPNFTPEAAITPWTIRPDWKSGVTERLQWLTDVLISQDGAEQRRRLRQAPRRVVEANFTLLRDQRRLYDSYMAGPQASVWRVPLWWERNRLALPADPASRSLTFPFAGSEIAAGDTVMLVGPDPFAYDLALVSGVADGGVVLATKLSRAWPAGSACYPTKKAILIGNQTATRRADDAVQVPLQFQVVEPNDYAAATGDAYQGVPVLGQTPDWATDTTAEHQRMLVLFDNQTGLLARRDTALRAFMVQQFAFTARGRADQAAFRSLLYYLAGRLRPAWVPTFMRDFALPPGGRHAAGTSYVTVRRSGYTEFGTTGPVGSHTGRQVLLIAYRNGTLALHAVIGYVLTDAESETIQLDPPLGQLVEEDTVQRMSFVQVMRQDQDEVTLLHVGDIEGATQVTTTFRSCDAVRVSYPYAVFAPVAGTTVTGDGTGNVVVATPDQSQGVQPGTPPVVVDPVSLALTGGAG